jgi:hypothetical protein
MSLPYLRFMVLAAFLPAATLFELLRFTILSPYLRFFFLAAACAFFKALLRAAVNTYFRFVILVPPIYSLEYIVYRLS